MQNHRAELEARVAERTAALEAEMEQRKRVEATLAQAQKLEAVGQLTAGIAHDFNNILTVLLGNLEILKRVNGQSDPARFGKLTTMMRSAIEQATRLTSQLLVFSRKVVLHPKTVMADHIVRDFLPMLKRAVGEAISIEIVADPALWPCHVDPTQLEAAILNVVLNARDAMPQGGLLKIELRNVALDSEAVRQWNDVAPGDYVSLSVTDTGTGIPGDVLPHLFEPFFTTKEVGKGSGMGLAMIWGFAKHSGGHVTVESEVGQGATVTLYLPRAEVTVVREEACAVEAAKRAGTGTILLVEDEAGVAEVAEMMLTDLGYAVRTAASGVEALRILQKGLRPDLVMSDIVMPGMSGVELADEVQRRYPDVEVLLTSGYPDHVLALHGGGKLKFPLLSKPYQQRSLAEALASVLNET